MKTFAALVVVALCSLALAENPSPEHPVGWRGDGAGRYPNAEPPTSWERKRAGEKYSTQGIVYATPLPERAVASPIIVGEKIFITGETADLICLEKKSGRILWIRSNSEFEGLDEKDRAEDPAYAALAPMAQELEKLNAEIVTALNAQQNVAPTGGYKAPPAVAKKRELEKKIQEAQLKIDKKKFDRYWGQGVFGFAGQTPVSDGKHVGVFFTTGLSAVYDLDGNRQWIHRGSGGGSEHGNFASPIIADGKLIVWANEMRAYEIESGKLAWKVPAKAFNTYGSLFSFKVAGESVAAFQWGFFVRVSDGKPIWDSGIFGDSVSTPIIEGDTIYTHVGYPKNNDKEKSFRAYKLPAKTSEGKLTLTQTYLTKWADDEIPVDEKKAPFDRGYVASPLYVDGLVYQMTQGGGLIVHDAKTGETVYRKVLPVKPKTEYWNWAGASASPTLAGKYIYLMDNQGACVILEPGRSYKEIAINKIEEIRPGGKEQEQFLTTPVFEGTRMYFRSPGFLYCVQK